MKCLQIPMQRAFLLLLLAWLGMSASSSATPEFGAPEVVKLDWSTRAMVSGDVNGDGLLDIVLLNNDKAQVTLLYQLAEGEAARPQRQGAARNRWEPVLEDAHFRVETISVGFAMFDLALGDMNLDGRPDLIYTARDVPLTIRFQGEDGSWMESAEYDDFEALGWVRTLGLADLDGDGQTSLVVLAADALRLFPASTGNEFSEPEIYPITGENPFNLLLTDVTGDERADILFLSADGEQSLVLREQMAGGEFGPEIRSNLKRPSRMLQPIPGLSDNPANQLLSVDARGGTLEFLALVRKAEGGAGGLFGSGMVSPSIYPVPQSGASRISPSYALVDFHGDGHRSLAVANPTKAEILIYESTPGGFKRVNAFPTFSNVNSLSGGRFFDDQLEDLIVLSETEKTLGLSHFSGRGRLEFPRALLPVAGEPVVGRTMDLDQDGYDELALVVKREGGAYWLLLVGPEDRSQRQGDWTIRFELELAGVRRAPSALRLLDTFTPAAPGIIVFVPREPPVLLAPSGEPGRLELEATAVDSPIRESLLKGATPSEVAVFDSDRDGRNELVVGRTGFARAFRFQGDALEMVDQFNARRGSDVIGAMVPEVEDGVLRALAFYIEAEGAMQFLRPDADGVFRYERSVETGRMSPVDVATVEDADGGRRHLFLGADRFWLFAGGASGDLWEVSDRYETDLEQTRYTQVLSGDFTLDGQHEILAVDGTGNVADLLVAGETGWQSRLYWQIFEQDMHYQGRKGANIEPREMLINDFTGDGKPDFVFLLHDRLLMYPQK